MTKNPAYRAYLRRFWPAIAAYVAAIFLASAVLGRPNSPTGAFAYALAILPALPLIGIFWIIGLYLVEEKDEYLRMLMVRQILIATGFTLSLATLWGFLEIYADASHIPLFYVTVTWFGGWGLGSFFNKVGT